MKFPSKNYQTIKIKKYFKKNSLFFFVHGTNQNVNNWIKIEQELTKINFNYYKIFNKTALKTLNNSIYINTTTFINGTTFLIKPFGNSFSKSILLNNFEPLLFTILAVKFNNKIYGMNQLKYVNSLNFKNNLQLFYQFRLTNLKFGFKIKL